MEGSHYVTPSQLEMGDHLRSVHNYKFCIDINYNSLKL